MRWILVGMLNPGQIVRKRRSAGTATLAEWRDGGLILSSATRPVSAGSNSYLRWRGYRSLPPERETRLARGARLHLFPARMQSFSGSQDSAVAVPGDRCLCRSSSLPAILRACFLPGIFRSDQKV